jgi:hypothetical protein
MAACFIDKLGQESQKEDGDLGIENVGQYTLLISAGAIPPC